MLRVDKTVIENVEVVPDRRSDQDVVLAHVRVRRGARGRCGVCLRPARGYDQGGGRRRWRHLDFATAMVFLEADAPRVTCRRHGVVVAHVPWARHGAGHTRAFDQTVAWLATRTSKAAVTELMRIAWRSVGAIIARVWADEEALGDRLDGLRRIGIDEVSYKRGHRYLLVVVDHDTGRLVWATPGRDQATLNTFFDQLGPERCAQVTHVSADAAPWIAAVVAQRCPAAVQCADPFHIVAWATEALDEVRRDAWRDARAGGHTRRDGLRRGGRGRQISTGTALKLRHSRYALWKNPDHLTDRQRDKLAWIAKTDPRLHRAYLLKEGLRFVFILKNEAGKQALDRWLCWAARCRIPQFVHLARRVRGQRDRIHATLEHGLSNALIESVNTKIRLITRLAFGFRSPHALIALAMLSLGGTRPRLPDRSDPRKQQ